MSQPPDRSVLRAYAVTNLVLLPGVGTFLSGQRLVGVLQATLALAGFVLTLLWFVTFVAAWNTSRAFPADGGPHLRIGLLGFALFGAAWCWALARSLRILRAARTTGA